MPVPAGLQGVVVTVGPLYEVGNDPLANLPIRVRLDTPVGITASGAILPSSYSAVTDSNGQASIELVASDSTGLDTNGFTYNIYVPGHTADAGADVLLLAANTPVRLEDLSPISPTPGTVIYVPSDITDGQITGFINDGGSATRAALDALYAGQGGAVASVDGRTGVVTLGDLYDAAGTAAAALTAHHDPGSTDHDDRYYTEAEIDTALGGKQNTPTGTPDGTKYLRDDNSWQAVPAPGASALGDLTDVDEGTPAAGEPLVSDGDGTWSPAGAVGILEGDSRLTNPRAPTAHTHPTSEVTGLDTHIAGKKFSYGVEYDYLNSRWPAVPAGGNPAPPDGSLYYEMSSILDPAAGAPDDQTAVNDWSFLASEYYVWRPGSGVDPT